MRCKIDNVSEVMGILLSVRQSETFTWHNGVAALHHRTSVRLCQIHPRIFWYISFQQIISLNKYFLNKRNACSSKLWNYICVWAMIFDIYLFSKLKSCYIFSNLWNTMEVELKWNIWILNAERDNKSLAGQTFDFIEDVEDSVFETTNLYLENR